MFLVFLHIYRCGELFIFYAIRADMEFASNIHRVWILLQGYDSSQSTNTRTCCLLYREGMSDTSEFMLPVRMGQAVSSVPAST